MARPGPPGPPGPPGSPGPSGPPDTVLGPEETGGLGTIRLRHPPGTFALTPASRITVAAVGSEKDRLRGAGIDWGCGVGCVAIAAARIPAVHKVVGLDIRPENVRLARENVGRNGVADTVVVLRSDSYAPTRPGDHGTLEALEGRAGFVVANPPASKGDDGFGWRREVARGAVDYLRPGGVLLVQISSQYGPERVRSLEAEGPGLRYDGEAATTDWVPFIEGRPRLLRTLETFAAAEAAGSAPYAFRWPDREGAITAAEALDRHRDTGVEPLSRWQVQRYVFSPPDD